jgi:hypothetical protein
MSLCTCGSNDTARICTACGTPVVRWHAVTALLILLAVYVLGTLVGWAFFSDRTLVLVFRWQMEWLAALIRRIA